MLSNALKEWASVCHTLTTGQQILILRKGGIAEPSGDLTVSSQRFWLYPTYVHQQKHALKSEYHAAFDQIEQDKPVKEIVQIQHFAELVHTEYLENVEQALIYANQQPLTEETVRSRFEYRRPGLHVFVLRVFQIPTVIEIHETPEYAGCKSWVELTPPLLTESAIPVLNDSEFDSFFQQLPCNV